MSELIRNLRDIYDYVLVDTPPYGIIADAAPLVRSVDGVVMVAKFNQTRHVEFDKTVQNLKKINATMIGSVLSAFNPKKVSGYYESKQYYQQAYTNYANYAAENRKS